jgi:hypothetical protein
MTGVVAAAADELVQIKGDLAGIEQISGYGSQLNEAGYAVIADLIDGAELGEIARLDNMAATRHRRFGCS